MNIVWVLVAILHMFCHLSASAERAIDCPSNRIEALSKRHPKVHRNDIQPATNPQPAVVTARDDRALLMSIGDNDDSERGSGAAGEARQAIQALDFLAEAGRPQPTEVVIASSGRRRADGSGRTS